MRGYPRLFFHETYEAVINRHTNTRIPLASLGDSESHTTCRISGRNYQYAIWRPGSDERVPDDIVVAPYACLLAAPLRPLDVLENLENLTAEGALGPMGFYEAIDYTKSRLDAGQRRAIVRTYMAHHHGMSLVALNNTLNDNVMQARFHADARVQAAELLLQERSPQLVPLDRPPEEHKVEETPGRMVQPRLRRYTTPHTVMPRAHLLSNGSLSVMMTNSGGGYTRWGDIALTRWRG